MIHTKQDDRDLPGDFFPLPKNLFRLGLSPGEIAVYAYLMYCEDRSTFQCYPSYDAIGRAVGMSDTTVHKYVRSLERKHLIRTEPTTVRTKDGRVHNGSLKYTVRNTVPAEEACFQKQIQEHEARKRSHT